MTVKHSLVHNQLAQSIDKLLHYLAVYVKRDTTITVYDGEEVVYSKDFRSPKRVAISSTLYTRIDGCHGAGNCCRVPFDLVYTPYDYQRIVEYDHQAAVETFGMAGAIRFRAYRGKLLESLKEFDISIGYHDDNGRKWADSKLYVKRNTENFYLSGNKSCPYLFVGEDRYFCGVHPFKPLHCWYPHMTVRATETRDGTRPGISIGRMQYGRNHNFGCPVLFGRSTSGEQEGLFDEPGDDGAFYFDKQFADDIAKLNWTSKSAESLGFNTEWNFAVGIDQQLERSEQEIRMMLASSSPRHITLWER